MTVRVGQWKTLQKIMTKCCAICFLKLCYFSQTAVWLISAAIFCHAAILTAWEYLQFPNETCPVTIRDHLTPWPVNPFILIGPSTPMCSKWTEQIQDFTGAIWFQQEDVTQPQRIS